MSHSISISTATRSDQPQWDEFVLSQQDASPYHLFAWGQAVEQAYGHTLHYLMAWQNGKLVGVLPLVHLKLSFLVNALVALPFCDVGNCLCSEIAAEVALLREAIRIGNYFKTKEIQLRGPFLYAQNADFSFSRESINKVRMLLELPDSSEALLKSFKSKLRSQVLKAEKNGVVFRWAGLDGVDSFYAVFCRNMHDLGSPVHSHALFLSIMEHYGENARIGLTEYGGKCIGAGLILSTNNQTAIPWASTLREYNWLGPNMLLYWNCLMYAADSGRRIFDFGRSTENEGTCRFKKQWGAQPVPLTWYTWGKDAKPAESVNSSSAGHRQKVENMWKKLPLSMANLIGSHLRKYISL